jgi:DNA mismatch repair protein MutH
MPIYKTKEQIIDKAQEILNKSMREMISASDIKTIEKKLGEYGMRRKGLLGELVEEFIFDLDVNNRAEADFVVAGIELKTNPLKKHPKKKYVSKERLVFSMINYDKIVGEKWETSSFLKKNSTLLIMFYLWLKEHDILDYKFKFVQLLDLLKDISNKDIFQIQKDWEFIVAKIKRGEAHLLSEGDTYYLGACTKAANSRVVRDQPMSRIPAKPRAFSFKQQYLNYLIQSKLLGRTADTNSIFKTERRLVTIEDLVKSKFAKFIGKTDKEILKSLNCKLNKKSKQYKRLIANNILGVKGNKIDELENANVTLKTLTFESTGTLKESISFPAFKYKNLVTQTWNDEENETMADFHLQLETKKFLFVIFQKQKNNDDIILTGVKFWNFPMKDMEKARNMWEKTIELINEGSIVREIKTDKNGGEIRYTYFPDSSYNGIVHVRPHGKNSEDVDELPVADQLTGEKVYTKHCFWLNTKYIQKVIEEN